MSLTITQPAQTLTLPAVLADYELHRSGDVSSSGEQNPNGDAVQWSSVNQPDNWYALYRRVPACWPINRHRDPAEIVVYTSPVERVFISVMFAGVYINATTSSIWRRTLGRLNDKIFHYAVGGEF